MAAQAQALRAAQPTCPQCGQELRKATSFDGSPSNATAQFLWCSNQSCTQFGIMREVGSEEPTSRPCGASAGI